LKPAVSNNLDYIKKNKLYHEGLGIMKMPYLCGFFLQRIVYHVECL
jgi:hypothetical protein